MTLKLVVPLKVASKKDMHTAYRLIASCQYIESLMNEARNREKRTTPKMASKRTRQPHRFPGRPFLLDNTPEWEEFWIKSTVAETRKDGKAVQVVDMPPFCVTAYETDDSFIGRRKGVSSTMPTITWLKALFVRVEAPKDE